MIAIVCNTISLTSETFIKRHIMELAPGKTVVVCTQEIDQSDADFPVFVDETKHDSKPWHVKKIVFATNLIFKGYTNFPDKYNSQRLLNFLKSNNVKVILAEFGHLGCYIQPVACRIGVPLYIVFRGYDASRLLRFRKIRYSYRRLLIKTQGFICVSQFIANKLKAAGVFHPNTHIIPSGVDIDLFTPGKDKDANMVLAIGRFVEKKAPDKTILAFSKAISKNPNLRLEMVGDGPLLSRCRDLIGKLGLKNSIILHGSKDHEFVRKLMSRASMLLQHSVTCQSGDTEGLPVSIQEAMSCGLAVVSTRHAGIPEAVIEEETGLLVDEHDINEMSKSIERLIIDPQLREKMGIAGRKRAVEKFSVNRSLAKYRQVLGLPEVV